MSDTIAVLEKLGIDPESPSMALSALQTAQLMRTLSEGSEPDPASSIATLEELGIDPNVELASLPAFHLGDIYTLACPAPQGGTTCVDFSGFDVGDQWAAGSAQFSVGAIAFDVDYDGGARINEYPAFTPGRLLECVGDPISGLHVRLPASHDVELRFVNARPDPVDIEGFDSSGRSVAVATATSYNTLDTVRMGGVHRVVMRSYELLLKEVCYS